MRNFSRFVSLALASSILTGCGSEDFTGAYRYKIPGSERVMVLNVHGDEAEIFGEDVSDGRIKPLVKMNVSVKDKKLLLDDVNSSERLALTRNVDEQSVDCLNCKVLGINDAAVWKYDPQGPYDVEQMLKDQALKDEEALNAEMPVSYTHLRAHETRGLGLSKDIETRSPDHHDYLAQKPY